MKVFIGTLLFVFGMILSNGFNISGRDGYCIGFLIGVFIGIASIIGIKNKTAKSKARNTKFQYTIKAHPTKYKGVMFRSRLEARWAAFFDLVGWEWEYEPIDLNGWTPDFRIRIPGSTYPGKLFVLVEIKPYFDLGKFDTHVCLKYAENGNNVGIFGVDCGISRIFYDCLGVQMEKSIYDFVNILDAPRLWQTAGRITQYKGDNSGR
jgi:hypothetical protein